MDEIFKEYGKFMFVYVNDILIASDNISQHEKNLKIFALKCLENRLAFSKRKAEIKKEKIEILGLNLDNSAIKLESHNIKKK